MPDRSWNRQLAAGDTQPIPHSLATVVARLLANDAAGRRASGPDDSICFISPDERRVAQRDASQASQIHRMRFSEYFPGNDEP